MIGTCHDHPLHPSTRKSNLPNIFSIIINLYSLFESNDVSSHFDRREDTNKLVDSIRYPSFSNYRYKMYSLGQSDCLIEEKDILKSSCKQLEDLIEKTMVNGNSSISLKNMADKLEVFHHCDLNVYYWIDI